MKPNSFIEELEGRIIGLIEENMKLKVENQRLRNKLAFYDNPRTFI